MAITKKRRVELIERYGDLLKKSEAIFIASYTGLPVKMSHRARRRTKKINTGFSVNHRTFGERMEIKKPMAYKMMETAQRTNTGTE